MTMLCWKGGFEVYWSEERYSEVLGNKSILYSSGTLLRVFECIMTISLVCVVFYYGGFNLMCFVIYVCEFL